MIDEQDLQPKGKDSRGSVFRIIVSGIVLLAFWGILLYDYWPELVPAALRMVNSARSVGAVEMESKYFQVMNNSHATRSQVKTVVTAMEKQYEAISQYTKMAPSDRIAVLIVNGEGPAMIDGAQIVLNYDNGKMDTSLVPLYLVVMIENIRIDLTEGIVPSGGYGLQVLEDAGLGEPLIRQPLDSWTVLFQQIDGYLPLDEAWFVGVPNDDNSIYTLMRAMLESGSFLHWFSGQYGPDNTRSLVNGESSIESISGKSLAENEREWLNSLSQKKITPKSCQSVIPKSSLFFLMCRKIQEKP